MINTKENLSSKKKLQREKVKRSKNIRARELKEVWGVKTHKWQIPIIKIISETLLSETLLQSTRVMDKWKASLGSIWNYKSQIFMALLLWGDIYIHSKF